MMEMVRKFLYLLIGSLFFIPLRSAFAATFTIADGDVTGLISAINTANSNGEVNVINLASTGTYTISSINNGVNGLPQITSNLTINGNGATITRDTASADQFRFFQVNSNGILTLNDVAVLNGASDYGAGIFNMGTSFITNVAFTDDNATSYGGGIFNNGNAYLTISNSIFDGNTAGQGGGIYNMVNGSMVIEGSTFSNHQADRGAGIYNRANATITNSSFTNNSVGGGFNSYGGGLYNTSEGTITVRNTQFSHNSASLLGGGMINEGQLTMEDSVFDSNTSSGSAGALVLGGGSSSIARTTFNNNTAQDHAGAIYNNTGINTLDSDTFTNNSTLNRMQYGFGGAIFDFQGPLTIINTIFSDNTGNFGGAIYQYYQAGQLAITQSVFKGNIGTGGRGGSVYVNNSAAPANLSGNCIVGNTDISVYDEYFGVPGVSALRSWWGSATGPTSSSNTGGDGDSVGANIDYSNWLTEPPAYCPDLYLHPPTPTPTPTATPTPTPTPTPPPRQLTALSPAKVWVGLKNSDDIGIKFDLLAQIYSGSTLVSSGELDSVVGGSSGFNNAKLDTIPFNSFTPVDFPAGSTLNLTLSVRNACTGSTHNSGTARLWYGDSQASSQFDGTIGNVDSDYFLLSNFVLSTSEGTLRQTVDVAAGSKCSPFKPFGTWTITP